MAQPAELIKFLRGLRQVRNFTSRPVPEDALNDVLEVARWSGSANNRQPVEIVVVREAAARQKLVEYGANTAATAPVAIVIITPGEVERAEHEMFDEGRLTERILLAAAAHGVDSGVAWLKGEGPTETKKMLGIPPERRVRTVVALGSRDDAAPARPKQPQPRKPTGEFVHWDRY
jgi:nitroreductase